MGGGVAALGAVFGVAGFGLSALRGDLAPLAVVLWSLGAVTLAAAAWMLFVIGEERRLLQLAGWMLLVGLLGLAVGGVTLLVGPPTLAFPLSGIVVLVALALGVAALWRAEEDRLAALWLTLALAGLLMGLVVGASPIAEVGFCVFFGAWLGPGFLATRPQRTL